MSFEHFYLQFRVNGYNPHDNLLSLNRNIGILFNKQTGFMFSHGFWQNKFASWLVNFLKNWLLTALLELSTKI